MRPEVRVLVLTPDFPPARGGIQVLVHRLACHARLTDMRVVTLDGPGGRLFDRGESLDVRRVRRASAPRAISIALLNGSAIRAAFAFRPHVVLSAHIVTSPAAAAIRRALEAPVVQYLYADEARARPRLTAFALRNAEATVVLSRHTEGLAIACGADPGRLRRIPPGVDLPARERGEQGTCPTILTIARLGERYKGHDTLVRAMPLIRARVPDAQWIVVGDGPLRPQLEGLADAHGLNGHVRFVGQVTDAERDTWLDRAHVFAMPSRLRSGGSGGEGFGIAYLEAGAHGLPVVAGNVAGALDSVVNGKTGLLVDASDHVAVADAVSELLLDPEWASALGRAGAARARRFAWPTIAGRVEELLLQAAGQV
jgi:phosphatidylinositol alpha-1,6-mannosyltransferase